MNYLTEFKIQQLRTKNLTTAVESISIVLGAVIANMLVPQLLIKYVYTDPTALLEAPAIFTSFPLITYSIALGFFLYAMVGNFIRSRKANVLEQEFMLTGGCCSSDEGSCCGGANDEDISEEELKELERIVDEALKPAKKKFAKKAKKSTKTKAKKKSAKK